MSANGWIACPMVAVFLKVSQLNNMFAKVAWLTSVAVFMNTVCHVVNTQIRYRIKQILASWLISLWHKKHYTWNDIKELQLFIFGYDGFDP